MKKIQKLISSCHDCEFCKKITSSTANNEKVTLCDFELVENEERIDEHVPFLLNYTKYGGTYSLDIPDNCPLEDYKQAEI